MLGWIHEQVGHHRGVADPDHAAEPDDDAGSLGDRDASPAQEELEVRIARDVRLLERLAIGREDRGDPGNVGRRCRPYRDWHGHAVARGPLP